jgi:hypothetical protein
MIGAPDTIRTCDLCLRRAALYPAELRVLNFLPRNLLINTMLYALGKSIIVSSEKPFYTPTGRLSGA